MASATRVVSVALEASALRRRSRVARFWQRRAMPYLMLVPAFALLTVALFVPIAQLLWLSLLRVDVLTLRDYLGAPFAGLDNYRDVLAHGGSALGPGLGRALRNSLVATAIIVPAATGLGLAAALAVDGLGRGGGLVRTLLVVSLALPAFVLTLLWTYLLDPTGVVDDGLRALGISPPVWYDPPNAVRDGPQALVSLVVPAIWHAFPFAMLVVLAALRGIPRELHEAAMLDGAGASRRFWHVTLPLLRAPLVALVVVGAIFCFNAFPLFAPTRLGLGSAPSEWHPQFVSELVNRTISSDTGFTVPTGAYGVAAATVTVMIAVAVGLAWAGWAVARRWRVR